MTRLFLLQRTLSTALNYVASTVFSRQAYNFELGMLAEVESLWFNLGEPTKCLTRNATGPNKLIKGLVYSVRYN